MTIRKLLLSMIGYDRLDDVAYVRIIYRNAAGNVTAFRRVPVMRWRETTGDVTLEDVEVQAAKLETQ